MPMYGEASPPEPPKPEVSVPPLPAEPPYAVTYDPKVLLLPFVPMTPGAAPEAPAAGPPAADAAIVTVTVAARSAVENQ